MNNKQSTIWIDMTDLSQWRGNMTGVQRTVYEISKRYKLNDSRVKFFVYDEHNRCNYEVMFDEIEETALSAGSSGELPRESQIKRLVRGAFGRSINYYRGLSSDTKDKIPESVVVIAKLALSGGEKVARTVLHQVRESKRRKAERLRHQHGVRSVRGDMLFARGDVVIVLGASWDSKTKMIDIAQARKKIGFVYVQLIHDVIPTFNPHLFGKGFAADFDSRIFESIANADLLLCNSLTTESELRRLCSILHLKVPPVSVVRLGDDYTQGDAVRPKCDLDEGEKFILCVGTYEIRKNHMLLYYAAKEAVRRGVEIPKIIIIGRPGWLVGDLTYILNNDPQVVGKIQYLGAVTDEEKTWLFRNCSFTIFPAVFEGWGLPVGESLYYKKPCLSSSVSSMPEIGGDLVDYFSPFDSGECLDMILEYLDDKVIAKKTEAIIKGYRPGSWDQTYEQVKMAVDRL